jgi:hypothetical protein
MRVNEFLFMNFIDVNANGQKHVFRREALFAVHVVKQCYGRVWVGDDLEMIRPDKSDQYFLVVKKRNVICEL